MATRDTISKNITLQKERIREKINGLKSISDKLELFKMTSMNENKNDYDNNKVFIVHGHDNETKQMVARVIEKLDLTPVILHEQPNEGQTIIEKLEKHSDVGFAFVILSPDDEGKAINAKELKKRARQNVLVELGYFIGKLGRKRVCPLHVPEVEIPSDFDGVLYIPIDGAGSWKIKIVQELQNIGYNVDANKLL